MVINLRPDQINAGRILLFLLIGSAIVGCNRSASPVSNFEDSQPAPSAPPFPVATDPVFEGGHFQGTAAIRDDLYHVEALFTVDGAVRLYIGARMPTGSSLSGGGPPTDLNDLDESAMFVGQIEFTGDRGSGHGAIIGQSCVTTHPGRYCGEGTTAEISFLRSQSDLTGELRVHTTGGAENWLFDIRKYSLYYNFPVDSAPAGGYKEELAQFAPSNEMIISIDGGGQLFFQSHESNCVGNGSLVPHLNGEKSVWDVRLQIGNCSAEFAPFNGNFEGLATSTQGGYWDYSNCLMMFLSSPQQSDSKVAVTTYGCST